jgi:ABC-type branched-subunit amino acid transport system ATPase component
MGTFMLVAEQHVRAVLSIADRAHVLRRSLIVMSGEGTSLMYRLAEIEEH